MKKKVTIGVVLMLILVVTLSGCTDDVSSYPSGSISGKLIDVEKSGHTSVIVLLEDKKPIRLYSNVLGNSQGEFLIFCENHIGETLLIEYTYKETVDCYYLIDYSIVA